MRPSRASESSSTRSNNELIVVIADVGRPPSKVVTAERLTTPVRG
jgi:hypothetical protein